MRVARRQASQDVFGRGRVFVSAVHQIYLNTLARGGFWVVFPETQTGGRRAVLPNLRKKKKKKSHFHLPESKAINSQSILLWAKLTMELGAE